MSKPTSDGGMTRRRAIIASGLAATGGLALTEFRNRDESSWRAEVFIAKAEAYTADLESIVRHGLNELGLSRSWARGKSVLLKPNLVEPSRTEPHVNTHPALIRSVAEVFRSWDAREVFVAEGAGHCRDTDLILEQSGLGPELDRQRIEFVDLNYDDPISLRNRFAATSMANLYLPSSLRRADLVVSLPKMKTHHWAGVTLSMKNLFGMMPGLAYGWPKNVLHRAGIVGSILDINAAVKPHLAILDGIIGMEGDGPIMGPAKHSGVLVMGMNLPAVDATAARLMEIDPQRIPYLAAASGRLGPIAESHIQQRGESIKALASRFALLDHPSFEQFRPSL